jgi:hypothetical protein
LVVGAVLVEEREFKASRAADGSAQRGAGHALPSGSQPVVELPGLLPGCRLGGTWFRQARPGCRRGCRVGVAGSRCWLRAGRVHRGLAGRQVERHIPASLDLSA